MATSAFAVLLGFAYLALGLLGLVPAMLAPPPADAPPTNFALLYGYLFGLFPVNVVHSALHVALGFWGVCAGAQKCSAVAYARALAVLLGVLALLGLFPATNTLFGFMPIDGHDVWLHALTAVVAAHFGWRLPSRVRERRRTGRDRRQRTVPVAQERRFGLADRRETYPGLHAA